MQSTTPTESSPLVSGPALLPRNLYTNALRRLAACAYDAFATFELASNARLWCQVSGTDLRLGNCPWPVLDESCEQTMQRLGVPVPPGFAIVAEDRYDMRVITFNCDTMTPETWAEFIHALFTRVHNEPGDYCVKGWITRAD